MERLVLGEFRRTLDERFRLTLPQEFADWLPAEGPGSTQILAKERAGALSLWQQALWEDRLQKDVEVIRTKLEAGHLKDRVRDVQMLGRLLSTRHREVPITARGRLTIPEAFRDFLGVEQGGDVMLVGAALCVEIWHPESWVRYLNEQMPSFGNLIENLAS